MLQPLKVDKVSPNGDVESSTHQNVCATKAFPDIPASMSGLPRPTGGTPMLQKRRAATPLTPIALDQHVSSSMVMSHRKEDVHFPDSITAHQQAVAAEEQRRKATPPDLLELSNMYFDRHQKLMRINQRQKLESAQSQKTVHFAPTRPATSEDLGSRPVKLTPLRNRPSLEESRIRIPERYFEGEVSQQHDLDPSFSENSPITVCTCPLIFPRPKGGSKPFSL